MFARTQSSRFGSRTPSPAIGASPLRDPSRGRGNAAMIERLNATRGLELDEESDRGGGAGAADSQEFRLQGDGDLLFASSTNASINALDNGSYTQKLLAAQAAHPEWTLAEAVQFVNSQGVNGTGSELAMTDDARAEMGAGAGWKGALIIGNQAYRNFPTLPGAARDATGMASTYEGKGYDLDHQTDRTGADLTEDLRTAGVGLGEGDEFLIYYAGHAYEKGLVGIDGTSDAKNGMVPNAEVLGAANRLKAAGVKTEVVLDACKTGSAVDQLVERDALEAGKEALEVDPELDAGTTGLEGAAIA